MNEINAEPNIMGIKSKRIIWAGYLWRAVDQIVHEITRQKTTERTTKTKFYKNLRPGDIVARITRDSTPAIYTRTELESSLKWLQQTILFPKKRRLRDWRLQECWRSMSSNYLGSTNTQYTHIRSIYNRNRERPNVRFPLIIYNHRLWPRIRYIYMFQDG
ncbi:unnamed protein product [Aphis gossypii]|uniref:Uncharacterized protein n=1 Tax=Aphis gossypii TaxID=80765 RepID=A0A9P0NC51_APHGO|nr:unnamed protein product [Aphis gossypii]